MSIREYRVYNNTINDSLHDELSKCLNNLEICNILDI